MYNPYYEPPGRARVRYSRTEVVHLALAVTVLTLAFAVTYANRDRVFLLAGMRWPAPFDLLTSGVAVTTGFVFHELAHKVVAQRFGHWAEFRAWALGLTLPIVTTLVGGVPFAAPGAVMIRGDVSRRENGIISLVGPGTNFLIAAATAYFTFLPDQESAAARMLGMVALVNAGLCVFNLVPFGWLDGRKVWAWSKTAYVASAGAAVFLLVVIVTGEPFV